MAGRIVADRYALSAPERDGPDGSTWRARDLSSGAGVRVLLAPQARLDEPLRERAARLRHPALPLVLAQGADGADGYIVVPLPDGIALRQRVRHGGRLGPGLAAAFTATLAEALVAAHRAGLAYGGFDADQVLVLDGATPVFADPPLIADEQAASKDVRSLGTVLAACVGAEGGIHADDRPDLSPRFGALVASLMAADAPSSEAALEALRQLVDAEVHAETSAPWEPFAAPLHERAAPPPDPPRAARSTRRILLAILVGVIALVGGGALGAFVAQRDGGGDPDTAILGPIATESGTTGTAVTAPATTTEIGEATTSAEGPPRRAQVVTLLRPRVIDSAGDGENDDTVRLVIDGSATTGWSTEVYRASDLGAKDGIGLAFELAAPTRLRAVTIRSRPPGGTVRLYVDDGRVPAGGPEGWTAVGPAASLDRAVTRIDVRRAVPATRLLIWIEGLPPLPTGGYALEVLGIRVTGVPAGA